MRFLFNLIAFTLFSVAVAAQNLSTISVAESHALIQTNSDNANFIVLDVRTPAEYAQGHLQQSRLLNFRSNEFAAQLNGLDKSKTYLIYCRSGGRSGQALQLMEQQGFKSVYNMDGGFNEWRDAAFPFER